MLQKSLSSQSDTIIFDLEDSVGPAQKEGARKQLIEFLETHHSQLAESASKYTVRINALDTEFFANDISALLSNSFIETLVLPKVHSAQDLNKISDHIPPSLGRSINLVASIESARSLWNIGDIAQWTPATGRASVVGLLFAAEDYCADTGIIRTQSRQELLYTRSRVVNAAKTFGLQAIDMVCVNYKDPDYLRDECEDGRRLGFDGKQAIHPVQVETIQSTFAPSEKEINRATTILRQMEKARKTEARGAFGLEMPDGGMEMIDEPMVKQARATILKAQSAGLPIPDA
ncbi:beta subunit of citrate lyase [Clavulina sp. PMI_390]|nr:beta subunit of citrate lyase [Clavulina sp. PMI_390]